MRSLGWLLACVSLCAACGGETATDAGSLDGGSMDAAAAADAGATDAGVDAGSDAGVDAGMDSGPPPLEPEAFEEALLDTWCDLFVQCEPKYGPFVVFLELFACHPAGRHELFRVVDLAIEEGTVIFDEDAAAACLGAFGALTCADIFDPAAAVPDFMCDDAFTANVAAGGRCGHDEECVDGWCDIDIACPGRCQARVGSGMACTADVHCQDGLVCLSDRCEPPRDAGGACSADAHCAGGLICDAGTCATRPGRAQACSASTRCASELVCVEGDCRDGARLDDMCDAMHPCAPGFRCLSRTSACIAVAGPGEGCSIDEECPGAFWCDAGTCAPLPGEGDACSLAPSCLVGACDMGTCRRLDEDEACDAGLGAPFGPCGNNLYCTSAPGGTTCQGITTEAQLCTSNIECGPRHNCRDELGTRRCHPDECVPSTAP